MEWRLLPGDQVEAIHDSVLNPGELTGHVRDKSPDGALAQVENRVEHRPVGDVVDLAALYAMAIAQGPCFNDGSKRTSYRVMQLGCMIRRGQRCPRMSSASASSHFPTA